MKFIKVWIPVIIWLIIIFYLSHQPAQSSSELSTGFMLLIVNTIKVIVPFSEENLSWLHLFIRKLAHLGAYLILAYLLMRAFNIHMTLGLKVNVIVFLICVLFAVSDEVHQLFIPGRSGEVRDVLIDSFGSLLGIVFYTWVQHIKSN